MVRRSRSLRTGQSFFNKFETHWDWQCDWPTKYRVSLAYYKETQRKGHHVSFQTWNGVANKERKLYLVVRSKIIRGI